MMCPHHSSRLARISLFIFYDARYKDEIKPCGFFPFFSLVSRCIYYFNRTQPRPILAAHSKWKSSQRSSRCVAHSLGKRRRKKEERYQVFLFSGVYKFSAKTKTLPLFLLSSSLRWTSKCNFPTTFNTKHQPDRSLDTVSNQPKH